MRLSPVVILAVLMIAAGFVFMIDELYVHILPDLSAFEIIPGFHHWELGIILAVVGTIILISKGGRR